MPSYIQQLKEKLAGEVHVDDDVVEEYSTDASLFRLRPEAVVFPDGQSDVENLVRFVNENKAEYPDLSLTARSAGTCMSGGPLSESLVVGFTEHFDRFDVDEDNLSATVEPGVYYHDFENETLPEHISLPTYPASKSIAALGGMIANNGGGEKTLRYGKTQDYVEELEVVLADGNTYTLKKLDEDEVHEKMDQDDFEGEIYRQIYNLITENWETIKKAKPNVTKNSAGYDLWNVWNPDEGIFDLTQLFCGSQGTLGMITEAKLRLVENKEHKRLGVVFFKDWETFPDAVNALLPLEPESLETFDDATLKLGLRFMPQIAKKAGQSFLSFVLRFWPEFLIGLKMLGLPKLVMLVQFAEDSEKEVEEKAKEFEEVMSSFDVQTRMIESEKEAEKYWTMRRESFSLLRNSVSGKRTAPFVDDLVVQPKHAPEFLPGVLEILREHGITATIAGHAGSGNFHIIPLMDLTKKSEREKIPKVSKKVYDLLMEYDGSITAEHNDGLIRSPFLKQMYGDEVYGLFEKTKEIFDPDNIFNPGKKVGSDLDYAMEHIDQEGKK